LLQKAFRRLGRYVTEATRLHQVGGLALVVLTVIARILKRRFLFKDPRNLYKAPFWLRVPGTDYRVYRQVLLEKEYDIKPPSAPKTIIDAGANIGLSSIYFANRFPEASVIAVEPGESNFELLKKNCLPYPQIIPVQAALWDKDEELLLSDPGLGEWGLRVSKPEAKVTKSVPTPGITMNSIILMHGIEKVDILKIDIEGAEKEVFRDTESWLNKVDILIIELHERFRPGVLRSFYNGSNGFAHERILGENLVLSREKV
jgi:FkbM family methyltransferase